MSVLQAIVGTLVWLIVLCVFGGVLVGMFREFWDEYGWRRDQKRGMARMRAGGYVPLSVRQSGEAMGAWLRGASREEALQVGREAIGASRRAERVEERRDREDPEVAMLEGWWAL